jgi:hypothetical protein
MKYRAPFIPAFYTRPRTSAVQPPIFRPIYVDNRLEGNAPETIAAMVT